LELNLIVYRLPIWTRMVTASRGLSEMLEYSL